MPWYRLLVLILVALPLTDCARRVPRYAQAPAGPAERSDLDALTYGRPQTTAPRAVAVPATPAVGGPMVPVAETGPYTLDSGDKLRIVVFGQDTLSNTYTVDAAGNRGFGDGLVREKFIFVRQDVRGRFASEGTFVDIRPHRPVKNGPKDTDESTDTSDTIDWLVKNVRHNNGNVGMDGISYPGFFAAMGMIDSHPAFKAASPQAPISDWFMGDDLHHNGAFFLSQNFGFMYWFANTAPDPLHDRGE